MSEPAERTLKEMLREADDWIAQTALPNTAIAVRKRLEEAVRRAAEVARGLPGTVIPISDMRSADDVIDACRKAADNILADAGLDEEQRDE